MVDMNSSIGLGKSTKSLQYESLSLKESIVLNNLLKNIENNGDYSFEIMESSMTITEENTNKQFRVRKGTILSDCRIVNANSKKRRRIVFNYLNKTNKCFVMWTKEVRRIYPNISNILTFETFKELSVGCEVIELFIESMIDIINRESLIFNNQEYIIQLEEILDDAMRYFAYLR